MSYHRGWWLRLLCRPDRYLQAIRLSALYMYKLLFNHRHHYHSQSDPHRPQGISPSDTSSSKPPPAAHVSTSPLTIKARYTAMLFSSCPIETPLRLRINNRTHSVNRHVHRPLLSFRHPVQRLVDDSALRRPPLGHRVHHVRSGAMYNRTHKGGKKKAAHGYDLWRTDLCDNCG